MSALRDFRIPIKDDAAFARLPIFLAQDDGLFVSFSGFLVENGALFARVPTFSAKDDAFSQEFQDFRQRMVSRDFRIACKRLGFVPILYFREYMDVFCRILSRIFQPPHVSYILLRGFFHLFCGRYNFSHEAYSRGFWLFREIYHNNLDYFHQLATNFGSNFFYFCRNGNLPIFEGYLRDFSIWPSNAFL